MNQDEPELPTLEDALASQNLVPLWNEIAELMPGSPRPKAAAHLWQWQTIVKLAERAGREVPVGRGGERRALALANPGLSGRPFATSTLWAAIQYLNPGESAPVHRHTQNAFRFVIEGEGVWTVVDGDPVPMRRGDFLPQPGWHWHGHFNVTDRPMAWIDGLDIPFQAYVESTFFDFGPETIDSSESPDQSRSERLWSYPGLRSLTRLHPIQATPLLAYRWEYTNRALDEQLALEAEGYQGITVDRGHAAVRYVNPATGGDVMPTVRAEFHRLAPDTATSPGREVGSSVFQVFDGCGWVTVGESNWRVRRGDLFIVPSWQPYKIVTEDGMDLFRFSDAPIIERLNLHHNRNAEEAKR